MGEVHPQAPRQCIKVSSPRRRRRGVRCTTPKSPVSPPISAALLLILTRKLPKKLLGSCQEATIFCRLVLCRCSISRTGAMQAAAETALTGGRCSSRPAGTRRRMPLPRGTRLMMGSVPSSCCRSGASTPNICALPASVYTGMHMCMCVCMYMYMCMSDVHAHVHVHGKKTCANEVCTLSQPRHIP